MAVIVLDPGHGGKKDIGGSSDNNATSPTGVLEKNICLDMAKRIAKSLATGKGARHAQKKGKNVSVVLTRDSDVNLGLSDRAQTAADNNARLYLSIHCNADGGRARGTECWIDRKYMDAKKEGVPGKQRSLPGPGIPDSGVRNINVDKDAAFAKVIVDATVKALKKFDKASKLRSDRYSRKRHGEKYVPPKGVKMKGLGTLRDAKVGTADNKCRAVLLELEFIDNRKVDRLLNGGSAEKVRTSMSDAIAKALVDAL